MTLSMVLEHLTMVVAAVALAIAVGLLLGVISYLFPKASKAILGVVDVLQTIPALALLGMVMVLLGPGRQTVIVGLALYSLLPIVRNTNLGLTEVSPAIKEAARGMGMSRMHRLISVELPLAFPMMFAGIRIAAVNSVGSAVFAAFVGGGGLGSVINRGIRIQNITLILSGTLTLMFLAVALDTLMAICEKRLRRGAVHASK